MGEACSVHNGEEKWLQNFGSESLLIRDSPEHLGVDEGTILK
jgi:hypothetical protein